jgi:signal peptidase II
VRGLQERGPVAPLSRRGRRLTTALVAAGVVVLDQVTKTLAVDHLRGPVHLLGPLGLGLGYNSGAAFSLFTGRVGVLTVVLLAVVAALVWAALRADTLLLALSLGLVLGGALSNLGDRFFRGHHGSVVDFITLTHWPTFNLGDAAIVVGVVLIVLDRLVVASR